MIRFVCIKALCLQTNMEEYESVFYIITDIVIKSVFNAKKGLVFFFPMPPHVLLWTSWFSLLGKAEV